MDKKKIWESYRFPLILLGGIILGAILGAILGEKATVLAPIGNVFINLLFMVVVPMVLFLLLMSVGSNVKYEPSWKDPWLPDRCIYCNRTDRICSGTGSCKMYSHQLQTPLLR